MKGSISIYLLLAIAAYASLAAILVASAGYSSQKALETAAGEELQARLSAACTAVELLSIGEGNAAADYALLKGVGFKGRKASASASKSGLRFNSSRECLVEAGAGKILRVE